MQDYPLIGRLRERTELYKEIDNALNGRGTAVFVSGESGVGKTRLIEEVREKSGMKMYTSRVNDEGSSSYEMFKDLLREIINDNKSHLKSESLPPALSAIIPGLGEIPEDPATESIHHAVIYLLENAARINPSLIFFDDVQWADNASLELLQKIIESISSIPLAIIVVYRSDEIKPDHKIRRMRNHLRRVKKIKEIELKTLDYFETRQLIEGLLKLPADPSLTEKIYLHTQGLPLFTEEVVNTLIEENYLVKGENGYEFTGTEIPVPENIKDLVLQRISNFSEPARAFIEAASILGVEFSLSAASHLAGSEEGVDELFDKKIIYETGNNNAAFRHILIKESIQNAVSWSGRKNLHRQAALFYEENDYPPERIAEHWLSANDIERAKEALIKSIEHSCRIHAFNDAAERAKLALKIWPEQRDEKNRIRILYRYAHCSQINGKPDESLKALNEIISSTHFSEESAFAAEVFRMHATVLGLKGNWEESVQSRIKAAEFFMEAGRYADSSLEYLIAAGRNSAMLNLDRSLETADLSVKMAEAAFRNDLKARALGLYGNVLSMKGKFTAGKDVVSRALQIALESRDSEAASEVYRRLASTLEYASDYAAAKDAYISAYNYCISTGEGINAQVCLGCMSYTFFQTGDWKESLNICKKVISNEKSPENSKAIAYGITGLINAFRGEIKSSEKYLRIALENSRKFNVTSLELGALWGFALLSEYSGNIQAAAEKYNQIITRWYQTQDHHDVIQNIMWASEFFAINKMTKENAQCIEIITQIASATGNPEAMAALAYGLAEASAMNSNFAEAKKQYEQSLSHLEKLSIPVEQLRVEYRLGLCLIETGRGKEGLSFLEKAYRTAKNLSMRPFCANIAEIIRQNGGTAEESRKEESVTRADSAGLTRRQKEILEFLSQGLTNKEISGKIFLSTRTVDMHVSNILQRFNCRTRTEAVTRAKEMQII